MNVITPYGPSATPLPFRTSVTIGNFDGVHLGHQLLLERVRQSVPKGGQSGLITFDPHPVDILAPHKAPGRLTATSRKLELVRATQIDFALVIPFTLQFASTEAECFIEDILVRQLRVQHVIVGPDCQFGKGRKGNAALLRKFSSQHGYAVEEVESLMEEEVRIASSEIRRLIGKGEIGRAQRMLSRPHRISGPVVQGEQRGRLLGFPTANIQVEHRLLIPGNGVYYGRAFLPSGTPKNALINIGTRPTFGENRATVEVHLLDYTGDLYGETLEVEFIDRLRDERKFSSREELEGQIAADAQEAKMKLGKLQQ